MGGAIGRCVGVGVLGWVTIAGAAAAQVSIPPDTVTTIVDSDTVPGMGAVGGVVVDALGYVYFADFRNSVWRYVPGGRVELYATGMYGASGNAIGPHGELYQSSFNGGTISVVPRDGSPEPYVTEGLQGPVGIAVAPDGGLFVCDCTAGTVVRVAPDRSVSTFASGALLACPNGITFDDHGDLYVVNFGNVNVVKITPEGTPSLFAQIPGGGGNGHIVFARGGFYVTKNRGHRVFRLERDGTSRVVAGDGRPVEVDGPALEASLSRPNGIGVTPDGRTLWVNDLVSGGGVGGGPARSTLRRIRLVSLSDVLTATTPASGTVGVEEAYRAYREAHPLEDTAADAIAIAYQFLSAPGRGPSALAIFELNAEDHPDDPTSQFQLGEAYRYTGQAELAAVQYERVLELDPEHPLAKARLDAVRGS